MKNRTLKWLSAVPARLKLLVAGLTVLDALHGATGVYFALLSRNVVDAAVARDAAGFRRWMIAIILLVVLQLTLRALVRRLNEVGKTDYENFFKSRLTQALLHRDYLQVSAVHSAEWLNRLTSDTVVVAGSCVEILPGLAEMVVKLITAVVMILVLQPVFAAILLPGGAVMVLLTWLFRRVLKRMHKNIQEADGRLRVFLHERISSMLVIRSFAAEEDTARLAEEKMEEHRSARLRRNRFSNLCNIGFGAAMNGMYLLGFGWCGYGILRGTVSFGTLTAVTQLISQIQSPFANITGYLPRYYAMLASAERLMEIESFDEAPGAPLPAAAVQELYRNGFSAFGLRDASFAYYPAVEGAEEIGKLSKRNMPATLKHLSLEIRRGEAVAFTGPSGCGKSTALKLLMCVYSPDAGERYYVNQNEEVLPLTAAHRRLFAYVPQGNVLMNGSIREVVSFADPSAAQDDDRIRRALELVCADGFVAELDRGIDTLLGEHGSGLSEGQMQRLAIARAVFSDAPVLLLDEATSSLDAETERRLLENLHSLTDKTVVIVTHRPAALGICDRVLNFTENGVTEA